MPFVLCFASQRPRTKGMLFIGYHFQNLHDFYKGRSKQFQFIVYSQLQPVFILKGKKLESSICHKRLLSNMMGFSDYIAIKIQQHNHTCNYVHYYSNDKMLILSLLNKNYKMLNNMLELKKIMSLQTRDSSSKAQQFKCLLKTSLFIHKYS